MRSSAPWPSTIVTSVRDADLGTLKPALVVLAAGASRRLGECKALVRLGGQSPLIRLLSAGSCFDDHPALVLGGAATPELRAALPSSAELLHNPRWAEGRTGGLALAVEARPDLDLCVAPVDVPLVPAGVFTALLAAWERAGAPSRGWLAPRYAGRHGHPIVIGRELLAELEGALRAAPELTLRDLRRAATPCLTVEVQAPEVLDDLDTPSDLAALRRRLEPN